MAEPEPIPEGDPRPEGAVSQLIGHFDLDGNWSDTPVPGGRFEITLYDADGEIVMSAHGVTPSS